MLHSQLCSGPHPAGCSAWDSDSCGTQAYSKCIIPRTRSRGIKKTLRIPRGFIPVNTTFRSQVLVVAAVITAALCLNAENLILVKQSCSGRHCVSLRGRMKRIPKTRVEKSGTLDEGQDPISPHPPIPRSHPCAPTHTRIRCNAAEFCYGRIQMHEPGVDRSTSRRVCVRTVTWRRIFPLSLLLSIHNFLEDSWNQSPALGFCEV